MSTIGCDDTGHVYNINADTAAAAIASSLKDGDLTSLEQQDGDELGPFSLGLQARRVTTEGYVSRAFVLGSSTVLTDSQIHAMTDSQEFTLRVVEFLLNAEPIDLGIMAKSALRPQLSVESVTLGSVLLVGSFSGMMEAEWMR